MQYFKYIHLCHNVQHQKRILLVQRTENCLHASKLHMECVLTLARGMQAIKLTAVYTHTPSLSVFLSLSLSLPLSLPLLFFPLSLPPPPPPPPPLPPPPLFVPPSTCPTCSHLHPPLRLGAMQVSHPRLFQAFQGGMLAQHYVGGVGGA